MQYSTLNQENTTQIDILLFEKFSNMSLANAVEPLRAANTLSRRALYSWRFLTLDGQPVTSSSGLPIIPHGVFDQNQTGDMLIVNSSYGHLRLDTRSARKSLARAGRRYKAIMGLDSGAWLLASAGLLNGYRATIHDELVQNFGEAFLDVDTVQSSFVIDRNRITCGGAMATFDLMLELIGHTHGGMLRMDLAALFLHNPQKPPQKTTDIVQRATALMQDNIEAPLTIRQVCEHLKCNIKFLERRFAKRLGRSPGSVYQHLRLSEIRRLIETTDLPVTEISVRGGYENASAMTRAFSAKFGMSPRKFRRAINAL